ncbi:MAG: hypothetical protein MMC33_005778 [Icmadophila ericetorum]|nr:hypothetical protein [Icmadophila ericetorum]
MTYYDIHGDVTHAFSPYQQIVQQTYTTATPVSTYTPPDSYTSSYFAPMSHYHDPSVSGYSHSSIGPNSSNHPASPHMPIDPKLLAPGPPPTVQSNTRSGNRSGRRSLNVQRRLRRKPGLTPEQEFLCEIVPIMDGKSKKSVLEYWASCHGVLVNWGIDLTANRDPATLFHCNGGYVGTGNVNLLRSLTLIHKGCGRACVAELRIKASEFNSMSIALKWAKKNWPRRTFAKGNFKDRSVEETVSTQASAMGTQALVTPSMPMSSSLPSFFGFHDAGTTSIITPTPTEAACTSPSTRSIPRTPLKIPQPSPAEPYSMQMPLSAATYYLNSQFIDKVDNYYPGTGMEDGGQDQEQ